MKLIGAKDAPILVVGETGDPEEYKNGAVLSRVEKKFFESVASTYRLPPDEFSFINCAPPMPEEYVGDSDQSAFLAQHRTEFLKNTAGCTPEIVLALGKHALRQVTGRALKIGTARGQILESHRMCGAPILPLYGVRQCLWFPENVDMFVSDFNLLKRLQGADWDLTSLARVTEENTDYQWTLDISDIIDANPRFVAVDTETTGLAWYEKSVKVLTVQLTHKQGVSRVVPVDMRAARIVYPDMEEKALKRAVGRVKAQLRSLLTDRSVRKIGHNIKFDHHQIRESLGYEVEGWALDSQQLAFVVDDNMPEKSLDEVTRRWVPEMAGYADHYNKTTDKGNMLGALREDPDKFLRYAGGDTDANYRAARELVKLANEDERNMDCYRKIQLPALTAFANKVEPTGLMIDLEQLGDLSIAIEDETREIHNRVLSQISPVVRRHHLLSGPLSLTRPALKIDALFSHEGLGLEPMKFTKATSRKRDEEKIPSTSKNHLMYFADNELVKGIMDWNKYDKMRTTYVGKQRDDSKGGIPTGFWQYVTFHDGVAYIHPSFFLHRTTTGRTASAGPNAQNFPKRGELAKRFRSIFTAPPGWKIIEADLSQAELRIAASQAREANMIRLYNEGVDIHMNTAASVSHNPIDLFMRNKGNQDLLLDVANDYAGSGNFLRSLSGNARRKATVADYIAVQRFRAKAVNFGFLYGMQWRGFMVYAKTDYGLDYTEQESMDTRQRFFESYPDLVEWHYETERFVYEHGYVRSLHGALRRLPSIYSLQRGVQAEAVRQAINSPVQRLASDLGMAALWRLCRDCPDYIRPMAFIHDALLVYVREDMAEEAAANIRWYMESTPLESWFNLQLPVPILADASIGDRLSNMDEVDVESIRPDWHNEELDEQAVYLTV